MEEFVIAIRPPGTVVTGFFPSLLQAQSFVDAFGDGLLFLIASSRSQIG